MFLLKPKKKNNLQDARVWQQRPPSPSLSSNTEGDAITEIHKTQAASNLNATHLIGETAVEEI